MKEIIPHNGGYNFMVCILAGSYMHIITNETYDYGKFNYRNLWEMNRSAYLENFSFHFHMILRQLDQDVRSKIITKSIKNR
jgi:hypothetical protein